MKFSKEKPERPETFKDAVIGRSEPDIGETFKDTVIGKNEPIADATFGDAVVGKEGQEAEKVFDASAFKSFSETVAEKGKIGTRKAVDFSVSRAQAGAQATRKAIFTGGQQLPGTMKRRFLAGLKVLIPLGITILVLWWVFSKIDGILQPIVSAIFGRPIPGVGFAIILILILIVGIIVTNTWGRKLVSFSEAAVSRIPGVRWLYNGVKQLLDSFTSKGQGSFLRVVMVEFPKKGMRTMGFVTNETVDQSGQRILNVFVPTAPNPTSGFLQIMTEDEVIPTDISVDDALKMVMSVGKVSAKGVGDVHFDARGESDPEKV